MTEENYQKMSDVLTALKFSQEPEEFADSQFFKDWNEAAGSMIAKNTWELNEKGDILQVVVNSSTWAHELINQQQSIVKRMQSLGYERITGLSIRIQVPKSVKMRNIHKKTSEAPSVSVELLETFTQLAMESKNSGTRELFERLSQIKPRK